MTKKLEMSVFNPLVAEQALSKLLGKSTQINETEDEQELIQHHKKVDAAIAQIKAAGHKITGQMHWGSPDWRISGDEPQHSEIAYKHGKTGKDHSHWVGWKKGYSNQTSARSQQIPEAGQSSRFDPHPEKPQWAAIDDQWPEAVGVDGKKTESRGHDILARKFKDIEARKTKDAATAKRVFAQPWDGKERRDPYSHNLGDATWVDRRDDSNHDMKENEQFNPIPGPDEKRLTEVTPEFDAYQVLDHLDKAARAILNSDAYSPDGKERINQIHMSLRKPLVRGNFTEFWDAWRYNSGQYPDAFDEFIQNAFESAGLDSRTATIEDFIAACAEVTEGRGTLMGPSESGNDFADEDEEEGGQFYVAIWDEDESKSFVGMIQIEGGHWVEHRVAGKAPYAWGGSKYMSYLTPDQVMSWLNKDYSNGYEVAGPFGDRGEAMSYAEDNFGSLKEENLDEIAFEVRPDQMKHVVRVAVSERDHPMVTKRDEVISKTCKVKGTKESAVRRAMEFYRNQGYKVHDAHYVGLATRGGMSEDEALGEIQDPEYKAALQAYLGGKSQAGELDEGGSKAEIAYQQTPEFFKAVNDELTYMLKSKFGGKAWFKGGDYSYLVNLKRPRMIYASDGSPIRVKSWAHGLKDHVDKWAWEELIDCDPSYWAQHCFRPYSKIRGQEDHETANLLGDDINVDESFKNYLGYSDQDEQQGASSKDVANAIFNRIERSHPTLVQQYGHEVVGDAVEQVASFHAGTSELGSSDISIMVKQVVKDLESRSANFESMYESIMQEEFKHSFNKKDVARILYHLKDSGAQGLPAEKLCSDTFGNVHICKDFLIRMIPKLEGKLLITRSISNNNCIITKKGMEWLRSVPRGTLFVRENAGGMGASSVATAPGKMKNPAQVGSLFGGTYSPKTPFNTKKKAKKKVAEAAPPAGNPTDSAVNLEKFMARMRRSAAKNKAKWDAKVAAEKAQQAAMPKGKIVLPPKVELVRRFLNKRMGTGVTAKDMMDGRGNGFEWHMKSKTKIAIDHWDMETRCYNDKILQNLKAPITFDDIKAFFAYFDMAKPQPRPKGFKPTPPLYDSVDNQKKNTKPAKPMNTKRGQDKWLRVQKNKS